MNMASAGSLDLSKQEPTRGSHRDKQNPCKDGLTSGDEGQAARWAEYPCNASQILHTAWQACPPISVTPRDGGETSHGMYMPACTEHLCMTCTCTCRHVMDMSTSIWPLLGPAGTKWQCAYDHSNADMWTDVAAARHAVMRIHWPTSRPLGIVWRRGFT
jgi:hypothetical protein